MVTTRPNTAETTASSRGPLGHMNSLRKATVKSQCCKTALAAHSVLRKGKRYLRPGNNVNELTSPVEMRRPAQVDRFIARIKQKALQRLQTYHRYRQIFGLWDGLTAQLQILTRKRLERKFTVIMGRLRGGKHRLLWRDITSAMHQFPQNDESRFALLTAYLFKRWLERKCIDNDDTCRNEYWLEKASHKRKCCKATA